MSHNRVPAICGAKHNYILTVVISKQNVWKWNLFRRLSLECTDTNWKFSDTIFFLVGYRINSDRNVNRLQFCLGDHFIISNYSLSFKVDQIYQFKRAPLIQYGKINIQNGRSLSMSWWFCKTVDENLYAMRKTFFFIGGVFLINFIIDYICIELYVNYIDTKREH